MVRRPSSTVIAAVTTTVAVIAVVALTVVARAPASANGPDDAKHGGAQELGDPDYGVCRGTDPRCYHDWGNFDPANGYKILLYTRTAGPRHADLGPALPAGMNPPLTAANVVQNAIVKMGQDNGFAVDWTEDVTQLATPGRLFPYNAVVFFSTSRDTLDDAAQTSLRQYIRGGGGFVGIHNAFGTEYNWPWYEGLLGNANFYDHGPLQSGVVQTVDKRDASTAGLPGLHRRVVQPGAVPLARARARHGGREHAPQGRQGLDGASRPRRPPPCRVVPVLRRRPGVGDHARA